MAVVQQGEDANRSRRPEEEVTVTQRMEEAQANAQAPSLVPRLVGGAIGREGNMEGGRGRGREAGLGERPPHSCAPTPAPRALIRSRPGAVLDDPDESRQAPVSRPGVIWEGLQPAAPQEMSPGD